MIARSRRRRFAGALAAGLLAASVASTAATTSAEARSGRPGGGQSFGGRSSSGGKSGDGGGCAIDVVLFLVQLTFDHPAIGLPLDGIVVAIVIAAYLQKGRAGTSWSTTEARDEAIAGPTTRPSRLVRRELLATVTRADADFSIVLFEDFLYALFATVQEARGEHALPSLAPYLAPGVQAALGGDAGLVEVRTPVIGALRYLDVRGYDPQSPVRVSVEIEASFTERRADGGATCFYVVERWTLERPPTAKSRTPEKAAIIGCPSCGAPLSSLRGSTCSYCNTVIRAGQLDWCVVEREPRDRMARPPQLTSTEDASGAELMTVVDPDAALRLRALGQRDAGFQWSVFLARVTAIFEALQPAWSERRWVTARPFVSDQLFQMLAYWIETYERERMRNVTENARITGVEVASVISDRYFDAITVRVHAVGLDYTITDDGVVVSGSRSRERAYTEYWTLIRGASVQSSAGRSSKECPSCGAPLAINMAGSCDHCHAKVTSGEFDWVLSRIEQDQAYSG